MKYGIIGAGPSGLTMSMFLRSPSLVLEKDNKPGGHASSFIDHGFTFDYGPHIMFSKNKEILEFMISSLGKNIHRCRRNNKIYYKGRLIKYPFENDLKSLPLEDNFECLYQYIYNPYKKKYHRPKNLKQWFLKNFGLGICSKYLFSYNEKVWNIKIEDLSMLWSERIPKPHPSDIIKSALGFETEGYLHQLYYHYPLKGGYQAISEAWAKKAKIIYNFQVKEILKTKENTFIISNGKKSFEFNELISTIPVHELIKILKISIPKKVLSAVNDLIVNPMFVVCLGIKGKDAHEYTAVYFPEKDFLVNRICFPRTLSNFNAPSGFFSIQADITCKNNSKIWKKNDRFIGKHVIEGLIKKGFIKNINDVVYKKVIRVPYAYVVYDKMYERNTKIVREWFPKQGIHLVGRFSYFEYINVDMVIARSMKVAEKLNGVKVELDQFTN